MTMPTKSKSQITTKRTVGRRLPKHRPPTHPGEMLAEEFLKPLALTRTELVLAGPAAGLGFVAGHAPTGGTGDLQAEAARCNG